MSDAVPQVFDALEILDGLALTRNAEDALLRQHISLVTEVGHLDQRRVEILGAEVLELGVDLRPATFVQQLYPFIILRFARDHSRHRHLEVRHKGEREEPHGQLVDVAARNDALDTSASHDKPMRAVDE